MLSILKLPFTILAFFFGRLEWSAPPWLAAIMVFIKRKPKLFVAFLFLLLLALGLYIYNQTLPKPISIKATANPVHITPNQENAQHSPLIIQFDYDFSQLKEGQNKPKDQASVARIDLIGKDITQYIRLSPNKKGQWTWLDDRRIEFTADTDWPAGTTYQVTFKPGLFTQDTRLSESQTTFKTPKLTANFSHIELYQDPLEKSVRRVVATVQFSHPVDKKSFEERLSLTMRPSDQRFKDKPKTFSYSVKYDKNYREAYISSATVALPEHTNFMNLLLKSGVKSLLGGNGSQQVAKTRVVIPDLYSFLKVEHADLSIIKNQDGEPEQVLVLNFSDDIQRQELLNKLKLYILPKQGQKQGKNYWNKVTDINPEVLKNSQKVTFKLLENERNHAKQYSLVLDEAELRYLYVHIEKGLISHNNFISSAAFQQLFYIPNYPIDINIMGEGSILSLSGEGKLNVITRGTPALKYTIGRLLDKQITHLVSQTSGDISNPDFNSWHFNEENMSSLSSSIITLAKRHPKQANYSTFDLSAYLPEEQQLGLYFVNISAWDPQKNHELYAQAEKRLILMTDLGIIVKNNADNTHDVFIQSIATGNPVPNAQVSLLGKNGQTLFSKTTNEQGHVLFPSTQGLYREQTPTVYLVKTENDLSFIPFQRAERTLKTSKFDIGGVRTYPYQQKSLKAFMFTDRGIYRPGETVQLGMIVKQFDLSNVEGIPLELVIRNARNKIVKQHKFKLAKKGFNDTQFKLDKTVGTGRYYADLHIIQDNKYRGESIANLTFKVEEFQADTLKISSQLEDINATGWFTGKQLKAKVSLKNLFGTPAQERKITAQIRIKPHNFYFKQFADYQFSDPFAKPNKTTLTHNKALTPQRTDADGFAWFDMDLTEFSEGTYQLKFSTEGFDAAGGRSVKTSNQLLLSPLAHLVGAKTSGKLDYIHKDSERSIEYVAINPQLEKIKLNNLTLKTIQINTISTLVKQRNGTYQYQNIEKEVELKRQSITINKEGYQHMIDTSQAGNFLIKIIDAQQKTLSKRRYSVVGVSNLSGGIDQQSSLQLKLDKRDYFPGDVIEMSIKAPYVGAGLITIESDKVHHFKWFGSTTHNSIQHITLPEDIEGNAYISVSMIRDKNSKELFKSPLSYAIQPFSIDRSKRRVDIKLTTQKIVRPGKPMSIKYSTSKPSRIAIFAINEGILQVAAYKTPNPLGHFLQKRALSVETQQILDLILPDFNRAQFLAADGGGAESDAMRMRALAKNLNPFTRKLDKPAVYWSGIYDADSNTKEVFFDVPNSFAGQLRIMAVAVADEAVGATSQHALVRGPFVISPNLLNFVAPDDEFYVTVGVANIIEGSGKQAEVTLNIEASEHIKVLDKTSTTLFIDEGSEAQYRFKVKALNTFGNATLSFSVTHKNEHSTRSASFSVRPASHYVSSFDSGYSKSGSIDLTIPRQLNTDLAKQHIAASASPLLLVDGLSDYLEHFPHSCTEQVVSKVFPLVGLMSHPAYSQQNIQVQKYFEHVIDKLAERQQSDGGFAFWPSSNTSEHYPTIYAVHFLLAAQEQSLTVPDSLLQRAQQYLNFQVQQRANNIIEARNKANAIYLLTRMGIVTSNHLIDLEENLNANFKDQWQHDLLASYMAATYQLLQKDNEAKRLIDGYKMANAKQSTTDDFHTLLALDAQYVYLLAKHFKDKAKNLDLKAIHQLSELIFKGQYNTLSAAYSILALGAYSELALNNEFDENIVFKAIAKNQQESILNAQKSPFLNASYDSTQQRLHIQGDSALFYLNSQSGYDQTLPQQALSEGIEVYREFIDADGNVLTQLQQGQEVTVQIKVRALHGKTINHVALVDLLPAGFEVIRSSLSQKQLKRFGAPADYIDIREDRVVIYGRFDSSLRTIRYTAKVTAAGDLTIPPVYAESMYDRSIKAHTKVDKIRIIATP